MHGAAQWVTLATFFAGGTVILSPDTRLDAGRLVELVAAERATIVTIIGDAVGRPLADAAAARPDLDLSAVRVILNSGATVSPAGQGRPHGADARAPSSTTPTGRRSPGTFAKSTSGTGNTPTQGRFAPGRTPSSSTTTCDRCKPGSGVVGRLARGGAVALGYYNDPDKTATTFPVIDGVRYIVTGDHATVEADGTIQVLGRGTACINTGGEKVYPDEVEAALKSHPEIADAMVVGVARRAVRRTGGGARRRPGGRGKTTLPADLDEHVRRHVAGYKAPRQVFAVEAVERFPSGKPDYAWARELARRSGRRAASDRRASTSSHRSA